MLGIAAPEILRMHTRSHRSPSLTCITSSSNYQAAPAMLPLPLHIPPEVYIETKGMGLVWPAYLNASAIELRSSIPVHITHGSDKPPGGAREFSGGRRGMEMSGWAYFGRGLKSISSLSITEDGICGDSIHFFASMSQCNFASIKMSYLLEQWIRNSQRSS